ncbi:MAG: hypothetical protein K2H09_07450, partial [Treponemataceae bacterium]|nr:hypothetical protein [Treponemataceae bacterium]
MKGICAHAALVLALGMVFAAAPGWAEAGSAQEPEASWKEIGEQGKRALEETKKFFKDAGRQVGEDVSDAGRRIGGEIKNSLSDALWEATTVRCHGTWTFVNQKIKTTISCNDDGSMEISRKNGLDTDYWTGIYSATPRRILFSVREIGHKTFFTRQKTDVAELWTISYALSEEGTCRVCA